MSKNCCFVFIVTADGMIFYAEWYSDVEAVKNVPQAKNGLMSQLANF